LAFKDRKEELFEKRLALLRKNRLREYGDCLNQTTDEFSRHLFEATKSAAEFIDLDEATYEASVEDVLRNEETSQQFRSDEEQVRLAVDTEGNELLTRERTKELIIEKINMEFESER